MKPMETVKLSRKIARIAKFISDLTMLPIHYQRNNLQAVYVKKLLPQYMIHQCNKMVSCHTFCVTGTNVH